MGSTCMINSSRRSTLALLSPRRKSITPYTKKEDDVSDGCTRAEKMSTGLFLSLDHRGSTCMAFP